MTSSTDPHVPASPAAGLLPAEIDCLRVVAAHMIPASDTFGVPGADDPAIVADMVRSVERDREELRRVLHLVIEVWGGSPDRLTLAEQAQRLHSLRTSRPALFGVVEAVVSRAYYRDDRVLHSLGMEARPPFPGGFVVEQADWSLLDPVRNRPAMYRKTD